VQRLLAADVRALVKNLPPRERIASGGILREIVRREHRAPSPVGRLMAESPGGAAAVIPALTAKPLAPAGSLAAPQIKTVVEGWISSAGALRSGIRGRTESPFQAASGINFPVTVVCRHGSRWHGVSS